jgi:hypothetical protein
VNLKRKGKRVMTRVLNKKGDKIEHDELGWSFNQKSKSQQKCKLVFSRGINC